MCLSSISSFLKCMLNMSTCITIYRHANLHHVFISQVPRFLTFFTMFDCTLQFPVDDVSCGVILSSLSVFLPELCLLFPVDGLFRLRDLERHVFPSFDSVSDGCERERGEWRGGYSRVYGSQNILILFLQCKMYSIPYFTKK